MNCESIVGTTSTTNNNNIDPIPPKSKFLERQKNVNVDDDNFKKQPASRRTRRKQKSQLQAIHSQWRWLSTTHHDDDDITNNGSTKTTNQWISTHIWHAKRFHMHDLWGWQVPLLHTNRGTQAAVRLVSKDEKCLVQDVTWKVQPVECRITDPKNMTTLQPALRRIFPDFVEPTHSQESGKVLMTYGTTMFHEVDQHPMRAIGPVSYLIQSTPILSPTQHEGDEYTFFYFWVHPSIRTMFIRQIHIVLNVFSSSSVTKGPYPSIDGGVSCLQLRGKYAINCLQKCLSDHDDFSSIATINQKITVQNEQRVPNQCVSFTLNNPAVLCVWIQPRDPTKPSNYGVCGLDIFGSPESVKDLFLRLILRGGACPIGLIEEEAIRLEAQPPMTMFPRDFPDTEQGVAYWQSGESRDWTLLREHDYGSTGRIRNSPLSSLSIAWTEVVPIDTDQIVLLRGPFLKPFLDALESLGRSLTTQKARGSKFKKIRRRVVNRNKPRKVPKPSTEERAEHESYYCEKMAQSLSLPAALLCHVAIYGPGTMEMGTPLYRYGVASDELLGYAVGGSFSPSLGFYHGKAVVGASALLVAVGYAFADGSAAIERSQQPRLLVRVGEERRTVGSLSILV